MDAVGLEILERELAADRKVLADAARKAGQRIGEPRIGLALGVIGLLGGSSLCYTFRL